MRSFLEWTRAAVRTAIATPLNDAVLPSEQNWSDLDRRGNWLAFDETLNGTTTPQTRTRNGVNEYLTLDPDGGGSAAPISFTNDAAGNLTVNPLARNIGDGSGGIPSPSGQTYEKVLPPDLLAIRQAPPLLMMFTWVRGRTCRYRVRVSRSMDSRNCRIRWVTSSSKNASTCPPRRA